MNSLETETETETENDNDYVLIEEKTSSKKRKMKFLESIPTDFKDDDEQSAQTPSKKLVLYENDTGYASDTKIESPYSIKSLSKHLRGAKSIGAFTAQCSECFNWRLIPTIEKYEQIRENLSGNPFICERAEEWGRKVSCVDPSDINQDGSRIWAIDKPNIARTPQGWERLLKIRGEGSTRFADVYYVTPCGKKLNSMNQVQKYLDEHTNDTEGAQLSQFSFICPKPLDQNYIRKRPARLPIKSDKEKLLSDVLPISSYKMQVERPEPSASAPARQLTVKNKSTNLQVESSSESNHSSS